MSTVHVGTDDLVVSTTSVMSITSVLGVQEQHDNRQHRTLLVRAPLKRAAVVQQPDQARDHVLGDHELATAVFPGGDEHSGRSWPVRAQGRHQALLWVPEVPRHGRRPGERSTRWHQPDFHLYERQCRSVLGSFLRTTALQHLNRLAGWRNVVAFEAADVPMLENALIESALHSRPHYATLWFEDEGTVLPGLQSHTEMVTFYAGRRMPMSWLREDAARIARIMILPSHEPFRIEFPKDRRALRQWLQHPSGEAPARATGPISTTDLAYFENHGLYPPQWRPEVQRRSEWGSASARLSWENRGSDPKVLLDLPRGLTSAEQVRQLAAHDVVVNARTITRWRKTLIDTGMVTRGREPWHTSTTTRANSKKI